MMFSRTLPVITAMYVRVSLHTQVNKTRLQWGTIYGCEKNKVNVGVVVGLGIAASCLPILFYVGAKVCGVYCERQEAKKAS